MPGRKGGSFGNVEGVSEGAQFSKVCALQFLAWRRVCAKNIQRSDVGKGECVWLRGCKDILMIRTAILRLGETDLWGLRWQWAEQQGKGFSELSSGIIGQTHLTGI